MAENMFHDLTKLGLSMFENMDLYSEDKEKEKVTVVAAKNEEVKKVVEEDFLFDKGYRCSVCDNDFKMKTVRTGKARMIGADMDMRPKYEDFDPIKYDCIVCPHCGYAALSRFFVHVSPMQVKLIRTNISPFFKGLKQKGATFSYDDAIIRYELALANAVVKKAKASEKAYICLKIAWLKRGKWENLPFDTPDREKEIVNIKAEEKQYIVKAYEGFEAAMGKELFPICGMDEWTYVYLVAELGYECEDYAKSLKLLADLVVSKSASPKLKEKARELRKLMQHKA